MPQKTIKTFGSFAELNNWFKYEAGKRKQSHKIPPPKAVHQNKPKAKDRR